MLPVSSYRRRTAKLRLRALLFAGAALLFGLAAARPVHAAASLWRLQSGNLQLLTDSTSERDTLTASGWTMMGAVGCVCTSSTEESGLIPLYRLY